MDQNAEDKPYEVPDGAKHDGTDPSRMRWLWAKPWGWTDRRPTLSRRCPTALDEGGKGSQWYSLIDKVYAHQTQAMAAEWVTRDKRKAAGVDHVSPVQFARRLPEEVDRLGEQLRPHYEGLRELFVAEGIDPHIRWLYDFKLDVHFR